MRCELFVGDFHLSCTERMEDGKHLHRIEVEEGAVAPTYPAKSASADNLNEVEACKIVGSFLMLTDGPDPNGEFYQRFPQFGE